MKKSNTGRAYFNTDIKKHIPTQTLGKSNTELIKYKIKYEYGIEQTSYCIPSLINEIRSSLKQDLTSRT